MKVPAILVGAGVVVLIGLVVFSSSLYTVSEYEWVVVTDPPARYPVREGMDYRVRHQVELDAQGNRVRFRLWPEDEPEL